MLPQTPAYSSATHRTNWIRISFARPLAALAVFADSPRTSGKHEAGDVV